MEKSKGDLRPWNTIIKIKHLYPRAVGIASKIGKGIICLTEE